LASISLLYKSMGSFLDNGAPWGLVAAKQGNEASA